MGAYSHPKMAPTLMQRSKIFTSTILLTRINSFRINPILKKKKKKNTRNSKKTHN